MFYHSINVCALCELSYWLRMFDIPTKSAVYQWDVITVKTHLNTNAGTRTRGTSSLKFAGSFIKSFCKAK